MSYRRDCDASSATSRDGVQDDAAGRAASGRHRDLASFQALRSGSPCRVDIGATATRERYPDESVGAPLKRNTFDLHREVDSAAL